MCPSKLFACFYLIFYQRRKVITPVWFSAGFFRVFLEQHSVLGASLIDYLLVSRFMYVCSVGQRTSSSTFLFTYTTSFSNMLFRLQECAGNHSNWARSALQVDNSNHVYVLPAVCNDFASSTEIVLLFIAISFFVYVPITTSWGGFPRWKFCISICKLVVNYFVSWVCVNCASLNKHVPWMACHQVLPRSSAEKWTESVLVESCKRWCRTFSEWFGRGPPKNSS
jgi:hypothetical protein